MKTKNPNLQNQRFYIATVCGQHRQIADTYDIGIELDHFCQAEHMEGATMEKMDGEIRTLQHPERHFCLHAPFNELFPAAIDPKARALAMERLKQAARLAQRYGAEKMIVHSGYIPFVYFKEWHTSRSVEFWQEFIDDQPEDFHLVIENVLEDEPNMMADMMKKLDHPRIGICLDTGHANCMSTISLLEWLETLAPWLKHLHLHNNDGSNDLHDPIFQGTIDMEEFMRNAIQKEKVSRETTFTIESIAGASSMEWLKKRNYL